jgi:tetratricopeptide (TPR) repeat protein
MRRHLKHLVLAFVAALTLAAQGGRDLAKETKIEQELAQLDARQVELFREARIAMDKGDYPTAEKDLRVVCDRVPTFDPALRRLGSVLASQGQRDEALVHCGEAVKLKRSSENLVTLAYVLTLEGKALVPPQDRQRALELCEECARMPGQSDPFVFLMMAQFGLQLNRPRAFKAAAEVLRKDHQGLMLTHYFLAIDEAMGEHWLQAEREIRKAEAMGLPQEAVQRFLASGVASQAAGWRIALGALATFAGWIVGLILLFMVGFLLSRVTLFQINRMRGTGAVSTPERTLRRVYSAIIHLAGMYYYVSLPIVLALVVGLGGALIYGFFAAGYIPIKIMLLVIVGVFVTAAAMVKSLLLKVKDEEPGRPLGREEAEGLWQLAEEVAATLGTRPVDEIRITVGTDLAVYERGSWLDKQRDRAKRVLLLGTGVLQGFRQDAFRCVLAHEYGHFSHRDTAGGDVGLRVQRDMMRFYLAMYHAGQATPWNLAFQFLRVYNFLFRRISQGATRLHEVLADRRAAQAYGAPAFETGLRHVIHQDLLFRAATDGEIKAAIEARRPLSNLYTLAPQGGERVEQAFEAALNRPTTADDSHPGPRDRFRLISGYPAPEGDARPGEVWDLFRSPEAVTQEMMGQLEERVAPHRSFGDTSTALVRPPMTMES